MVIRLYYVSLVKSRRQRIKMSRKFSGECKKRNSKFFKLMSDTKEKIISSQTIANDLLAEMSAMLSQKDFDQESLQSIYKRMKELSDTLNKIPTKDVKF
jgi:DNA repair ATPase RecN